MAKPASHPCLPHEFPHQVMRMGSDPLKLWKPERCQSGDLMRRLLPLRTQLAAHPLVPSCSLA